MSQGAINPPISQYIQGGQTPLILSILSVWSTPHWASPHLGGESQTSVPSGHAFYSSNTQPTPGMQRTELLFTAFPSPVLYSLPQGYHAHSPWWHFFLFRPWVAYAPGIPCFLPLDDTHSKCSSTWKKNSWLASPLCACFWAREADLHSFQVDECGLSSTREWRWVAPHYLGICQFPAH